MTSSYFDEHALLADQRFLRRLARSLARDEHGAEDAVQETLARALRGARGRPSRAWLATVLRRVIAKRGAREAERLRVERRGARPERLAPAHDEVERRLSLTLDLADALRRLPEPYRTAVYLRYARELAPAEIAARLGVPLTTVKSRLRRGLAGLRQELDRRHEGGRAQWLALALELAHPEPAALAPFAGGIAMKKAVVVAALVVAALGTLGWLAVRGLEVEDPPAVAYGSETVQPAPAGPERAVNVERPSSVAEERRADVSTGPDGATRVSAAPSAKSARVLGRLLDLEREPLAGARVELSGSAPDPLRRRDRERVEREAITGADGRFAFDFEARAGFSWRVETALSGRVPTDASLGEVEPGSVHDLGERVLGPAGTVRGRVVGAGGAAPGGRWSVLCLADATYAGSGHGHVVLSVPVDPRTGEYVWDTAPPGEVRLIASAAGATAREGEVHVEVRAGEFTTQDFVWDGADLSGRIALRFHRTTQRVYPDAAHVRLLDEEGAETGVRAVQHGRSTYVFDGLAPGVYEAAVQDPAFEPWRRGGLEPGGAKVWGGVSARTAVAFELVDEAGAPVEGPFALTELRPIARSGHVARIPLVLAYESPADGVVRALDPRPMRLELDHAACLPVELDLPAPVPGEVLRQRVALTRGARVAGRVLDAAGAPAGGQRVRLLIPAEIDDSNASPVVPRRTTGSLARVRRTVAEARADEEGRFAFEGLEAGRYVVAAETAPYARASSEPFELARGESSEDLELRLGATARLDLRFTGSPGSSFEGLHALLVRVEPGAPPPEDPLLARPGFFERLELPLDADARLVASGLAAGEYELLLETPSFFLAGGRSRGDVRCWVERIVLRPGEQLARVLDLGDRAPRSIGLELRQGGERLPLAAVEARRLPVDPRRLVEHVEQAGWDGRLRFGPLFPGEWALRVIGVHPRWRRELGRTLVVGPDMPESLVLDVDAPVRGALRLVDARSGRPLGDARVWLSLREGIGNSAMELVPDATGRVELEQPPGELRLRRARDRTPRESREAPWTTVRWPPAAGEEPTVRLP